MHIVKYLTDEQDCEPSCLDENNNTPLHRASIKGHVDIVKFFTLENPCDPTSQNFNSNIALHNAVICGHLEVVTFLIEELKCPPDIPEQWNMTPILMALHENCCDTAKYLQFQVLYIYPSMTLHAVASMEYEYLFCSICTRSFHVQ